MWSFVYHKIHIHKGSIMNFKVEKKDILGRCYGRLKFTSCIDIHGNHESLISSPVKSTYVQSYPFFSNPIAITNDERFSSLTPSLGKNFPKIPPYYICEVV